jgi:hypothetical protein
VTGICVALIIVAIAGALWIGEGALLYNKVFTTFDPRMSGPLRPTPEQQARFDERRERMASGSVRTWRRAWPVCVVIAIAGIVLVLLGRG